MQQTQEKSRTTSRDLDGGRPRQSGFPGTNPLRIRDFLPLSRGRFSFWCDAIYHIL